MTAPSPSDTASLASPEATIARLQQEKQNLETQNAQLWRLCDKQRQMIIGLQKDLDRLGVKERERTGSDTLPSKTPPSASASTGTLATATTTSAERKRSSQSDAPSSTNHDRHGPDAIPPKSAARISLGASPGKPLPIPMTRPFEEHLRDGTSSPISPALSLRLQQVTGGQSAATQSGRIEEGERIASIRRDRVRTQPATMSRAASHQQHRSDASMESFGDLEPSHSLQSRQADEVAESGRHARNFSEPNISPRLPFKTLVAPDVALVSPERARWEEHSPERAVKSTLDDVQQTPSRSSSSISPPTSQEVDETWAPQRSTHTKQDSVSSIRTIDAAIEPELLRSISISMITSNHTAGEVTLAIGIFRKDMRLLHRLSKTYAQLVALSKATPDMGLTLPSRQDFIATSSAKADARRATTDLWFQMMVSTLVSTPVAQRTQEFSQGLEAFCAFLSSDRVCDVPQTPRRARQSQQLVMLEPVAGKTDQSETYKEGYLSKRGKTFGGWKARYFIIDGPCMRYFDAPGGLPLGDISLAGAQVGVQTPSSSTNTQEDTDTHAFLVLEPKRKGTGLDYNRHILCAISDMERDAWLKVLMHYAMRYTEPLQPTGPTTPHQPPPQPSQRLSGLKISGPLELQRPPGVGRSSSPEPVPFRAIGYRDTVPAALPMSPGIQGPPASDSIGGTPYEELFPAGATDTSSTMTAVGPTDTWSSPSSSKGSQATKGDRKSRKKSFWVFGKHGEQTASPGQQQDKGATVLAAMREAASHSHPAPVEGGLSSGTLFGMSLAEAVALSSPPFARIPSVVYRCLQYLDRQHVEREEGIYRLSGSSSLIKSLRERFNQEVDIDLLTGPPVEVHAVAGMLKLYLRELPSPILPRDLQRDFLEIIEMPDEPARMATIKTLVHALPRENFELLQYLTRHLFGIVQNEPLNKMSLRNVGIVFSPTLNIPASVFGLFIEAHEQIFGEAHLASTSNAGASILAGYLQDGLEEGESESDEDQELDLDPDSLPI
ncbi:hypothetical protein BCR37DRAFT_315298 [Protomyces lactucae-debilis]|uniref:Rho GTPase activation protein n=1 Tax=Protomyces lactucae-debilis TaxID=2754530 RepID=A0A1Y2FF29_PROLT|nr:uncharacterized protein BCR37DRAFT_315298 [Protomyces lactucae-debilis]ORY82548.1 hypothetical protein BCR37DRAFT_315298 [Protomyces lactucae-debilis]